MFKLIVQWWKNQFLAEGESQVKYQEDSSVTNVEPPELTVKNTYRGKVINQLGTDTFNLYDCYGNLVKSQLHSPTVSLLKLIKKRFDEDNVHLKVATIRQDTNEVGVRLEFTPTEYVDFHFCCNDDTVMFSKWNSAHVWGQSLSASLSILNAMEEDWVLRYVNYRIREKQKAMNQQKRDEMELKLQALLGE